MSGTAHETYPHGLRQAARRSARLQARLTAPDLLVAPGCFDCLTARLVETAGFEAAYITGSGLSMSCLGAPDVGLASFSEVADRVKRICDVLTIPVIADADTGFGGPLNIIRTVREFERSGVSAIQIEDQEAPKRCGHELGRKVVETREMEVRIKAACDARLDEAFAIVARTDARTALGLQAAIDRAGRYLESGADVLFVESPESEAEMAAICQAFPGVPLLANMVEGGRTPVLPAARLQDLGYRLAIFPNSLTRLIGKMGLDLLQELKCNGTTVGQTERMFDHQALWSLFDYDDWVSLEARYGTKT